MLEWVRVPHLLGNGLVVFLLDLHNSPHELAYGVELGPKGRILQKVIPQQFWMKSQNLSELFISFYINEALLWFIETLV